MALPRSRPVAIITMTLATDLSVERVCANNRAGSRPREAFDSQRIRQRSKIQVRPHHVGGKHSGPWCARRAVAFVAISMAYPSETDRKVPFKPKGGFLH